MVVAVDHELGAGARDHRLEAAGVGEVAAARRAADMGRVVDHDDAEELLDSCIQTIIECRPEGIDKPTRMTPSVELFLEQEAELRVIPGPAFAVEGDELVEPQPRPRPRTDPNLHREDFRRQLSAGVEIAQIFYHTIEGDPTEYRSDKYQHNRDIQPSLMFKEFVRDPQRPLPLEGDPKALP